MKNRLPSGQRFVAGIPVCTYGITPGFDQSAWDIRVVGLVEKKVTLSCDEFTVLPQWKFKEAYHLIKNSACPESRNYFKR